MLTLLSHRIMVLQLVRSLHMINRNSPMRPTCLNTVPCSAALIDYVQINRNIHTESCAVGHWAARHRKFDTGTIKAASCSAHWPRSGW